jgi:hypothetical protein
MRVRVTVTAIVDLPDGWAPEAHPDEPKALRNGNLYAVFDLVPMICDSGEKGDEHVHGWVYPHEAAEDLEYGTQFVEVIQCDVVDD